MNTTIAITIACIVSAAIAGIAVYMLVKKGVIKPGDLVKIDDALELIQESFGIDVFDRLIEYVQFAVRAVEQMYRSGAINAEERKEEALNIIENFAVADGVEFTPELRLAASGLIETECLLMEHNG